MMGFFDWKQILGRNWAWYSHQGLYDMVKTDAAGPSTVSEAGHAWAEFNALMAESRQNIDQLLREAGASWEGVAADSMTAGVMPLAQWTDDAGTAGEASGGSVQTVGSSFGYTANAMPEPVQVTSGANTFLLGVPAAYTHLFGGQTDQDRQEREAQEAKQYAVELMTGYSYDSGSAVDTVGVFVPPQDVTVNVAPPPQQTPGAVEYTGGEIHGPRGAGEPLTPPTPRSPDVPASGDGDPDSPTTTPGQAPGPAGGPPPPTGPQATPTPPSSPPTQGPAVNPVMPVETKHLPVAGFDPITGRPIDPRTGRPIDPTTGRPGGGGGPRGGAGGGPVGGSPDGEPARGRGGLSGSGPPAGEGHAGGRGAVAAGRAGAAHGPMAPLVPGAGARRDEDKERRSPDYLRDYHDEFWDTAPAVAPPVIGEEDPPAVDKDKEG